MTIFKPAFLVVLATVLTLFVGIADAQARIRSSSSSSSSKAISVLNMQAYIRTVNSNKNLDKACAKKIIDKTKADNKHRSSKKIRRAVAAAKRKVESDCKI